MTGKLSKIWKNELNLENMTGKDAKITKMT